MNEPIRGQLRDVTHKINVPIEAKIHNRFDIEVIDSATGKVRQRAQAENVICAGLWTRLLTNKSAYNNYIHYGSGSGTPAATDTRLFTFVAAVSSGNNVITADDTTGVYSLRKSIQLSETTSVGVTITEVGIGYDSSASTLCTHAMLKDMNGNQISISKTATDIINIYATVFVHRGFAQSYNSDYEYLSLSTYAFDADGSSSDGIVTALLGLSGIGAGGAPGIEFFKGENITWQAKSYLVGVTTTINASAKTVTFTASRAGASADNIAGGIKAIGFKGYYYHVFRGCLAFFAGGAWYPSTTVTGEAIATGNGAKKDFSTRFCDLQSATIYVNGAAQSSGVTVDLNAPNDLTYYENYFRLIEGEYSTPNTTGNGLPLLGDNDGVAALSDSYAIYYNPFFSLGIKTFYSSDVLGTSYDLYTSNDKASWNKINLTGNGTMTVPEANRYDKYWKVVSKINNLSAGFCYNFAPYTKSTINNIHFDTAPASGAVITADYVTKTIAKDINHVFDCTMTLQLGAYTA